MNRSSRFWSTAVAAALALSLAACGGTATTTQGAAGTAEVAQQEVASDQATLEVESRLLGTAYTSAKSTLKAENGVTVEYGEDSVATLTIALPDGATVDDSLIDSSNAQVVLGPGDAYRADAWTFSGDQLEGTWKDGSYEYRLKAGDIEPSNGDYTVDNGGFEWSALGSDGKGHYYFNLLVSGITYDGEPVADASIRAEAQVYGYDYTVDADGMYPEGAAAVEAEIAPLSAKAEAPEVGDAPVFTWVGEGEMPNLADGKADDVYVSWPEGFDASKISDADVSVILRGQYGDELELEAGSDFEVSSSKDETQVAITFQHWAFAPVYTTMSVAVDDASETFDIASVVVNPVQYGGGADRDGTVIVVDLFGIVEPQSLDDIDASAFTYTLATEQDGRKLYYAEREDGTGYLAEEGVGEWGQPVAPEEALKVDGTGAGDYAPAVIHGSTYFTERMGQTVDKVIDGKTVTLTKVFQNSVTAMPKQMELLPGYVMDSDAGILAHHKWAWQKGVEQGWRALDVQPFEGRYEWQVAKGESQQFTAAAEGATWLVRGNSSAETMVDGSGKVTVGADEQAGSFVVVAETADGQQGGVTIKVQ